MTTKRGSDRPLLRGYVEANETALIWNPKYGFRLAMPRKQRCSALTREEVFLGVLLMKATDPNYLSQITNEALAAQIKH